MRRSDTAAALGDDQASVAASGVKGMIPVGRPFLDYALSALADAGYREACLVIGPEHAALRAYYTTTAPPRRIRVHFALQQRAAGTAAAVGAAEAFAGRDRFLVVNSDNYYPVEACHALRQIDGAGLAAFATEDLVRQGNLSRERVARFPVVTAGPDGLLDTLGDGRSGRPGSYVSMNCWMFTPTIFVACRAISPAPSGELELPDAVRYAMVRLGERFRVLTFHAAVLDLTSRADIAAVATRLRHVEVDP